MNYLALGDSYTIGEKIDYKNNYPNQLVKILKEKGIKLNLKKIIAITGWTTDELAIAIAKENPKPIYDLVTLLIGVNNQYRGRSTEEFEWQFYSLLCQSILFAKGNSKNVIVISIPDWGMTPFNQDKDKKTCSLEIDEYNKIVKLWSKKLGCKFIDVTTSTRKNAENNIYLAEDLLHYSGEEYKIWANKIAKVLIRKNF